MKSKSSLGSSASEIKDCPLVTANKYSLLTCIIIVTTPFTSSILPCTFPDTTSLVAFASMVLPCIMSYQETVVAPSPDVDLYLYVKIELSEQFLMRVVWSQKKKGCQASATTLPFGFVSTRTVFMVQSLLVIV